MSLSVVDCENTRVPEQCREVCVKSSSFCTFRVPISLPNKNFMTLTPMLIVACLFSSWDGVPSSVLTQTHAQAQPITITLCRGGLMSLCHFKCSKMTWIAKHYSRSSEADDAVWKVWERWHILDTFCAIRAILAISFWWFFVTYIPVLLTFFSQRREFT